MRTAARVAVTRRQHVSPSISSVRAELDCCRSSAWLCSSALEAPRRREPDGVWIVQSVDFDDFIFCSQVQALGKGESDSGAKNWVSVARVRERCVVAADLEVVPEDSSAREQLDRSER